MGWQAKYGVLALPVVMAAGALGAAFVPAARAQAGRLSASGVNSKAPRLLAFANKEQEKTPGNAPAAKAGSRLILQKPELSPNHILSFVMKFTAAPGKTVGTIRAEITLPNGVKFRKVVLRRHSRLKVSAKQVKRRAQGEKKREAVLELTFSGGIHAIPDGVLGTLQFSTALPAAPTNVPVARVVSTAPPQTEQVTTPNENPAGLPTGPAANPAVSCFFFSH